MTMTKKTFYLDGPMGLDFTDYVLLMGGALDQLAKIPDESVQVICTSPPYLGARLYGAGEGELGQEASVSDYVDRISEIAKELYRVLTPTGTMWFNIGDGFAARTRGTGGRGDKSSKQNTNPGANFVPVKMDLKKDKLKVQDLMMVPARVAIRLCEDGWCLASEIVWAKPNPMPNPAGRRMKASHEMIYLLSKSSKRYFDWRAIGTQPKQKPKKNPTKSNGVKRQDEVGNNTYTGFNGRYMGADLARPLDVWTFPSAQHKGDHRATFPAELPRRCILAGSKPGDIVLDPFVGSGTTLVVAMELGRRGIGIDLKPEYVEMARGRIGEALRKKAEAEGRVNSVGEEQLVLPGSGR